MDSNVQKVINSGKKNLQLVSVLHPALEYGSEVWAVIHGRQFPWSS